MSLYRSPDLSPFSVKKCLHDESSAEIDSYKESQDDFGLIEWNVALDMLNIFAITFYQLFISFRDINKEELPVGAIFIVQSRWNEETL